MEPSCDCRVDHTADDFTIHVDILWGLPPLDEMAGRRRPRYRDHSGNSWWPDGIAVAATVGFIGARRGSADVFLYCSFDRGLYRTPLGRRTATSRLRPAPTSAFHADVAVDLCALRAIDLRRDVPSPRNELVAARDQCRRSRSRSRLDCGPRHHLLPGG